MIRFVKDPPGKLRRHYKNGEAASLGPITESLLIKHGQAISIEVHEKTIESNAGGLQPDDSKPKPGKVKPKNRKR